MSGSFQVSADQLRTHAANIGHASEVAAEAENAGQQVTPGGFDNAFGVICQFFPTLLKPAADILITAITETAGALRNAQQGVSSVADSYERNEEQIQQSLQQITGQLGEQPTGPVVRGGGGAPAPVAVPVGSPVPPPIPMPEPIREPEPPVLPATGQNPPTGA